MPQSIASRRRATLFLLLAAGLFGGGSAWMLVEKTGGFFQPSAEFMAKLPPAGERITSEQEVLLAAERFRNLCWNTGLATGLFGACTGAILGVASGILRGWIAAERGTRFAGTGLSLLSGMLCGGMMAAVAGYAGALLEERLSRNEALDAALRAIVVHALVWLLAGAGIGFGVGWPRLRGRRLARSVGAGMAAGVIAGLLYSPLAAVLFPSENSELALPTGPANRLFWLSLAGGVFGFVTGRESSCASSCGAAESPASQTPAATK